VLARRYLDAVLNLAYTLLRMLEKYSKSKSYMYVRKKKAKKAASKKKSASLAPLSSLPPQPASWSSSLTTAPRRA